MIAEYILSDTRNGLAIGVRQEPFRDPWAGTSYNSVWCRDTYLSNVLADHVRK